MNYKYKKLGTESKFFLRETSSYSSLFAIKAAIELEIFVYLEKIKQPVQVEEIANDLKLNRVAFDSLINVLNAIRLIRKQGDKIALSDFMTFVFTNNMFDSICYWVESCVQYIDFWKNISLKIKRTVAGSENDIFWNMMYNSSEYEKTTILSFEWLARMTGQHISNIYFKQKENINILDVGTGSGGILLEILQNNTTFTGEGIDIAQCKKYFNFLKKGLKIKHKANFICGDMYTYTPEKKFNYVILSWILHDLNDENAKKVIKHISKSLEKDGKIIIIERIDVNNINSLYTRLLSLEMFVGPGEGKERTLGEFNKLFRTSIGFKNIEYFNNIDGRKVIIYGR